MTPTDRTLTLNLLAQILADNGGNRITRALTAGIVSELDNTLPAAEPQPETDHADTAV